jgi:hypothetical protein
MTRLVLRLLADFCCSTSPFVGSNEGLKTQKKVWGELAQKLERIQPGILQSI